MSCSWHHARDIAVVAGSDRVAVLHLGRLEEAPMILTGTAAAIWEAVDGTGDDEAVASRVAARYDVEASDIRNQVLTFLRHLASCHLIART
ncbi:MAG: PqqD family peptide modification chaperone [Nocardioidaceae bacterium]